MKVPEINNKLSQLQIFKLFEVQLKKDFESSGCDADYLNALPGNFFEIRELISTQIRQIEKTNSSRLPILLYRVDVSEEQIRNYNKLHSDLEMEQVIAELIIKRILQKVILKKTYSGI